MGGWTESEISWIVRQPWAQTPYGAVILYSTCMHANAYAHAH